MTALCIICVINNNMTGNNRFPTTIPPSTKTVVENVAVTVPLESTAISDSKTILHDFNSHGLWGVTISLAVVIATFVYMLFT